MTVQFEPATWSISGNFH